jgi:hypothetical protein
MGALRLETMQIRAATLLALLALGAVAQTPVSPWESVKALAPGTEIRVASATAETIQGTLKSVTDSELVVLKPGSGPQSLPRDRIMSVSVNGKGHRLRNALIGLGVGTAVGVGVGYGIGHAGCGKSGGWCDLNEGVGVAIGGVGGLVGGTLTGVLWQTGGWRKIYTP